MDEILIEEKKYISSKRAAKVTGYAKDYIGQLCREGRVPARLVGRSWYVLEAAIQDHRFGATDVEHEKTEQAVSHTPAEPAIESSKPGLSTWEPPHYEAPLDEFLPSINRLKKADTDEVSTDKVLENLQDSWRTWFDRIADTAGTSPVIEKVEEITEGDVQEELTEVPKTREDEKKDDEGEVNVPIHAVYQEPPRELLPYSIIEEQNEKQLRSLVHQERLSMGNRAAIRVIKIGSMLLAGVIVVVAIIGTGYLDKYIISGSLGRIISGTAVYNK
ncbi:MAG TPA: hypothetical protein VJI70_01615 [Candidatus Paceibacterota bacterium]